jgi:hypothetical protein
MRWGMLTAIALATVAWAQADEQKPGIAVFDLKGIDTRPSEAEAASAAVARGLRELDAFEVQSSDDLRQLLSIERQKAMLGMENDTNVSAAAQALGVRHFVVGTVTRTSGGLSAELRLLDPKENKVLAQRSVSSQPSLDKLTGQLSNVVQELVGPLLFMEQGQLLVRTREEGAEVLVDEVSRGSTPLPAPVKLPRGRHRLTVKKDGFIARVTVANVSKEQLTLEDITLVPSADYMAAYNAKARKMRIGGFVATGAAAVALAIGIGLNAGAAESKYQNDFKPRQAVLQAVASGTATAAAFPSGVGADCFANQADCRTKANADAASINGMQVASWVLIGVAGVAAVAAAYCFISGDDPGRYTNLVASLLPGGSGLTGLANWW